MRTAIIGGKVITPDGVLNNAALLLENGKTAGIYKDSVPYADEIIDAGGRYVSPGFIDIHNHGGGGHDFMDGGAEAIIEAAKAHMRHGTTSICPTTLACDDEDLFSFFRSYREACAFAQDSPNLLKAHLEGPYFAQSQRGAQDPKYLRFPDRRHYEPILENADIIGRMTVAVELPGALELGDALRKLGILASIGHSDAEYDRVSEAFDHGYTHVTHLYSGMSSLHRVNARRRLGVVESAYLIDGMTVEIIADGCHLPPELLRLILRCKNHSDISLITDSMRGAGMPEGSIIKLGSLKNGQDVIIEQGVAFTPDHQSFAGSVCTADRCVRTMVQKADLSIAEAVHMMSAVPARILGIADHKGSIAPGMDADLCIFDDGIQIDRVIVGGKSTYIAGK